MLLYTCSLCVRFFFFFFSSFLKNQSDVLFHINRASIHIIEVDMSSSLSSRASTISSTTTSFHSSRQLAVSRFSSGTSRRAFVVSNAAFKSPFVRDSVETCVPDVSDEKPRRDVRHGFFTFEKPDVFEGAQWGHHGNVHGRRGRRDDDGTCSRLRSFPSRRISSKTRVFGDVDFWIVSRDAYPLTSSNTDKTISLSSRILLLPLLLLLLYCIRWT